MPGIVEGMTAGTALLLITGLLFTLATAYAAAHVILDALGRTQKSVVHLPGTLPSITALIAAKNEAAVLPSTLQRLIALPYPADKLRILVAVDEGDTATAGACAPFADRVRVIITHSRSGKPGVLNEILPKIDTELTLLLDADSFLAPDALSRMVPLIIKDGYSAASAQGYPLNEGEGIFPRFFKLECRIQVALNHGRNNRNAFTYTPGFGTLIITEEIRRVSGWDESCLSEDSDLALRLFANGGRIVLSEALVGMEAPATVSGYFRQRLRWYRGMLDIYWKRRDLILNLSFLQAMDITIQFLSPALVAMLLPFALGALVLQGVALPLLTVIIGIVLAASLVIRGQFSITGRVLNALLIIPFLLLNSAICIVVVITFLLNMRLPWVRTEKSHYQLRNEQEQVEKKD